jgi:TP901 family phage tail tape measure protein
MAADKGNPHLGMIIDVTASPGHLDMSALNKWLMNALAQAHVPVMHVSPNVKVDTKKAGTDYKAQMEGWLAEIRKADGAFKKQFDASMAGKSDSFKDLAQQRLAQSERAIEQALSIVSQKGLQSQFKYNKHLEAGLKAIDAGTQLTAKQQIAVSRYQNGMSKLLTQLKQVDAGVAATGKRGASFGTELTGFIRDAETQLSALKKFNTVGAERERAAAAALTRQERMDRLQTLMAKGKSSGFQRLKDVEQKEAAILYRMLSGDFRRDKNIDGESRLAAQYGQVLGNKKTFADVTAARAAQTRIADMRKQALAVGGIEGMPRQQRVEVFSALSDLSKRYSAIEQPGMAAKVGSQMQELRERLSAEKQNVKQAEQRRVADTEHLARTKELAVVRQRIDAAGRQASAADIEHAKKLYSASEKYFDAKKDMVSASRVAAERKAMQTQIDGHAKTAASLQKAAEIRQKLFDLENRAVPLQVRASRGGLDALGKVSAQELRDNLSNQVRLHKALGTAAGDAEAARIITGKKKLEDEQKQQHAQAKTAAEKKAADDAQVVRDRRMAAMQAQMLTAGAKARKQDIAELSDHYAASRRYYQSVGDSAKAAEYKVRQDALRDPGAALKRIVHDTEVNRGRQIIDGLGGISNLQHVRPENAQFVRAALQQEKITAGSAAERAYATGNQAALATAQSRILQLDGAMQRLQVTTQRTHGIVAQFFNYAIAYGGLWQALGAVKGLVSGVVELERVLVAIKAITGSTSAEMTRMSQAIFDAGRSSRYGLGEITDAAKTLAQAGVTVKEMPAALKSVISLAEAIEAPLAVSANLITSMREIFSGQGDMSLANQLAAAINVSKLTAESLTTIIGLSANVAQSMNLSSQQYLAAAATLKNSGLKDSTVATGMRQLLLELQAPDNKLVEAFQKRYAAIGEKMTNSNVRDRMFNMFSGPGGLVSAITELERLGYNKEGRQTFSRGFDIRSQNALEALVREKSQLTANEAKIKFSEAASVGSQQQMQTLNARLNQLKNSFVLFGDAIGRDALPPLMEFIHTLSQAVDGLTELDTEMKAKTGHGLAPIATAGLGLAAANFVAARGNLATRGIAAARGAVFGTAAGSAAAASNEEGGGGWEAAQYGLLAVNASMLAGSMWQGSRLQQSAAWQNTAGQGAAARIKNLGVAALASLRSAGGIFSGLMTMLGGPWILGMTAIITGLVYFSSKVKTAEERIAELRTKVDASMRQLTSEGSAQAAQTTAEKSYKISDKYGATGLAKAFQEVEMDYTAAVKSLDERTLGKGREAIQFLDQIFKAGGVSDPASSFAMTGLRALPGFSEAEMPKVKISDLSTVAAAAMAGPSAVSEKLEQMYEQLAELPEDQLTKADAQFLSSMRSLDFYRTGFGTSADTIMQNATALFSHVEEALRETGTVSKERMEKAKEMAKTAKDNISQAMSIGDFTLLKNSIGLFAAAMRDLGTSPIAALEKMRAEAVQQAADLRARYDARKAREAKSGREVSDDDIVKFGGEGGIYQGLAAEKTAMDSNEYTVKVIDNLLKQEADSVRQRNEDITREFYSQVMTASQGDAVLGGEKSLFEGTTYAARKPQYDAMVALGNDKAFSEGFMTMPEAQRIDYMRKVYGGGLDVVGAGRPAGTETPLDDGLIRVMGTESKAIKELAQAVGKKSNDFSEEKRVTAEKDAEIAARKAELAMAAVQARTKSQIGNANTVGELEALMAPGKANVFDQQAAALRYTISTEMDNAAKKQNVASLDMRHKLSAGNYQKLGIEGVNLEAKLAAGLAAIAEEKKDAQLRLEIARMKQLEDAKKADIKLTGFQLDAAVASGKAIEEVQPIFDAQQQHHRDMAVILEKSTFLKTKNSEASKEAAANYLAENVGIDKQVKMLKEHSAAVAENLGKDVARSKYESIGITKGDYVRRNAAGIPVSMYEQDAQDKSELDLTNTAYKKYADNRYTALSVIAQETKNAAKLRAEIEQCGDASGELTAQLRASETALDSAAKEAKDMDGSIDSTAVTIAEIEEKRKRNTFRGAFEYGTGIGESGAQENLRNIANGQLANAWTETGDAMRGGIVSSIDAIGDALGRAIVNGEKFKDVFKGLVNSIAVDLASFFAKKAVWWFLSSFLGGMPGVGASTSGGGDFRGPVGIRKAHGGTLRFSGGGMISGPGTGTSDSIPGMLVDGNRRQPLLLSNGESVLTAKATNMLGADFITAANRGNVRRQVAAGAAISRGGAVTNIASGNQTTNNLEVNVPVSMSSSAQGTDMDATVAQKLAAKVKSTVRETMMEEARPGGLLYRR